VLSRIAEALYWTGRYTERAEDTARLLDVAQRAALEGGGVGGTSGLGTRETLAAVLGGAPVPGSRQDILARYSLDRVAPESIAHCVRQARENARTIRDAVTSEMWEALNTWHLQVAVASQSELAGAGAHTFLSTMRSRAYLFGGCADATMVRTEGWHWLMLGRWLERLSFTGRVLGVRSRELKDDPDTDGEAPSSSYGWAVLLRSLSAYEAYRATYRAGVSPRRVAEFLLLDPDFPRSVRHCSRRVDEAVRAAVDPGALGAAPRLSGRLRGELDHREVEEVLDEGVAAFVGRLSGLAAGLHTALVDESFARGVLPPRSVQGGVA